MKDKKFWGTLAAGLLTVGGCSGHTVDPIVGGPQVAGAGGGVGVGVAGGASTQGFAGGYVAGADAGNFTAGSASTGPVVIPSELVGSWTGYVENYMFSDHSDAISLVLEESGSIKFGRSPAPAPATDPDRNYPIELQVTGGVQGDIHQAGPVPGFPFTIRTLSREGARLQLDAELNEPWTQWCELQTPIADETNPGNYLCIHNWGFTFDTDCALTDPATMASIPIDCGKFNLCRFGRMCACTAQTCSVIVGPKIHFDLNRDGDKANGSVAGLDGVAHNVHLTRN